MSSNLRVLSPGNPNLGQEQSEVKNVSLEPFLFPEQKKVISSNLSKVTVQPGEENE